MRISARDIKEQAFPKSFRGYEVSQVQIFLEMIALDVGDLEREREDLVRRVLDMEGRLAEYQAMERSLRNAMLMATEANELAEHRANGIVQEARAKSSAIVGEGETRRRETLEEIEDRKEELSFEVDSLEQQRIYAIARLKNLIDDQQAFLNAYEADDRSERDLAQSSHECGSESSRRSAGSESRVVSLPNPIAVEPEPRDAEAS